MMIELAKHYDDGPLQIAEIAARQGISVKYLEQLIIPLKKANYVKSIRGRKGGHMLAKSPREITVGEIVELLEGGINLCECLESPKTCDRSGVCPTRSLWETATHALSRELHGVTLSDMIEPKSRQSSSDSKRCKRSAPEE
jgi:Rrf2 family protein